VLCHLFIIEQTDFHPGIVDPHLPVTARRAVLTLIDHAPNFFSQHFVIFKSTIRNSLGAGNSSAAGRITQYSIFQFVMPLLRVRRTVLFHCPYPA
jgi:hypothetical protein